MSKKLFVIPGHGAGDSGAVGGGKQEALMVRELAARIKAWGGSNVQRSSYKRNYYADNGITRLKRSPKNWDIIELHMDSGAQSARGAHVIVSDGVTITKKHRDMADAISRMLPGRAEKLKVRDNLANPHRARAKGFHYMLVEFGFISNPGDRKYFETHMDEIAKAVLVAHGIKPLEKPIKVRCPWGV